MKDDIKSNWEQGAQAINRLFEVAQPSSVFSPPTRIGEHTLITASEVWVGMGFGIGTGDDHNGHAAHHEPEVLVSSEEPEAAPEPGHAETGEPVAPAHMGGGGGGGSGGRPVAIIDISPDGVSIKPIMDITKVALAFAAALGSMLPLLLRVRRMMASQK